MKLTPPEYYEKVAKDVELDMPEAAAVLKKIANEVRAIKSMIE